MLRQRLTRSPSPPATTSNRMPSRRSRAMTSPTARARSRHPPRRPTTLPILPIPPNPPNPRTAPTSWTPNRRHPPMTKPSRTRRLPTPARRHRRPRRARPPGMTRHPTTRALATAAAWYHQDVWLITVCVLVLLCTGCGRPSEPTPTSSTEPRAVSINPARIDRARGAVPDGYEVAGYAGPPAPITLWGSGTRPCPSRGSVGC